MLSTRSRLARSRLANAAKRGEAATEERTDYRVERAIDTIRAINGATTREQRGRLHAAVEATRGGEDL